MSANDNDAALDAATAVVDDPADRRQKKQASTP
jgi:hypothetical protein